MNRKSVLLALSSYDCQCETQFNPKNVKLTEPLPRDEFEPPKLEPPIDPEDSVGVNYTCPDCETRWEGRVDKIGGEFDITLQSGEGTRMWGMRNEAKVLLDHSEGKRIVELLSELDTSSAILQLHFERLDSKTDQHLTEMNQDDMLAMIADIKAYLAEAYSFEKTFNTALELDLPEAKRAQSLFERYKEASRVVNGLRIYTQKERNLRPDFQAAGESQIRPVVDVETVKVMESEVSVEPPDGYREGHEKYYGHVTGDKIDLHEVIRNHVEKVQWFVEELAKAISGPDSEARTDLEEWVKLREKYLEKIVVPPEDE
jgi:hypothetical protein